MPSRRTFLELLGAGLVGVGSVGTYAVTREEWDPDPVGIRARTLHRAGPVGGEFRTYGADAGHRGFVEGGVSGHSGTVYWETALESSPTFNLQMPSVSDGQVYVSTDTLHALDQRDGSLRWGVDLGHASLTSPTVAEDAVVVGARFPSGGGGLLAFDPADGERLWRTPEPGLFAPKIGMPFETPVVHDGVAYVHGNDVPKVAAIDVESGEILWKTEIAEQSGPMPAPAVSDDGVYVIRGKTLFCLELSNGSIRWQVETEQYVPPTVADGVVYTDESEGVLSAREATTGDVRWTYDHGGNDAGVKSLSVVDGVLYLTTFYGVNVLEPTADGVTEQGTWTVADDPRTADLQENGIKSGLATADRFYVGIGRGLAAFERASLDLEWYIEFSGMIRGGDMVIVGKPGAPAIASETVYVLNDAGVVRAIGA